MSNSCFQLLCISRKHCDVPGFYDADGCDGQPLAARLFVVKNKARLDGVCVCVLALVRESACSQTTCCLPSHRMLRMATPAAVAAAEQVAPAAPLSFAPAAENTMFRSSLTTTTTAVAPHHHHHHAHGHYTQQQQHHHHAQVDSSTASATAAAFQYLLQQNALSAAQHAYHNPPPPQQQFPLVSRFGVAAPEGDEDDDVFQLWYEPEHDETMRLSTASTISMASSSPCSSEVGDEDAHAFHHTTAMVDDDDDEPALEPPPSSTNSLLFEPLDLPPKSTGSTGSLSLEQTLKDAFLNYTPEASPANSLTSPLVFDKSAQQSQPVLSASLLRSMNMSSSQSSRSVTSLLYGPPSSSSSSGTLRAGLFDQHEYAFPSLPSASTIASPPTSNSSLLNAILGITSAPWMTAPDAPSVPNSSTYQPQQQPPSHNSMQKLLFSATAPANASYMNQESATPLWISTSMLATPTSQLPAPERTRKGTTVKKPRARRTPKTSARRPPTGGASPLALSLAGLSRTDASSGAHSPTGSAMSDGESTSGADKGTKGKKCVEAGCARRAQSNSRCKAHGGGARCQYTGPGGCTRSSQGGGFCRAHGGGKRCEFPGCVRGQQRKGRCYVHGGIRKCQMGPCEKKDRGNGFCIAHGGGKRCEFAGCSRAVRRGLLCQLHESAS